MPYLDPAPAARSGISPAAPQRTQEAISAMGFDLDFFANVNAVEVLSTH